MQNGKDHKNVWRCEIEFEENDPHAFSETHNFREKYRACSSEVHERY